MLVSWAVSLTHLDSGKQFVECVLYKHASDDCEAIEIAMSRINGVVVFDSIQENHDLSNECGWCDEHF